MRVCKASLVKDLVFIIGSGSSEFEEDLKVVREVLEKFGYEGYFALLSEKEKGLDAFCDKICSKILSSQFCVVMLNDPVLCKCVEETTKKEKILRAPRPNVYYEFGIAVAACKNIIPIMRKDMKLPFDVQHLDVILYENPDELRENLTIAVKETRGKPRRRGFVKEPDLELLLIGSNGNPAKSIHAKPTYERVITKKTKSHFYVMGKWSSLNLGSLYYGPKGPSEDLVPIGISISNEGEAPATGIRIFLTFPSDCELFDESMFTYSLVPPLRNPTSGGLYVDDENKLEAIAWINKLSNDLTKDNFKKVYVKFPPKKREYKIKACITQDYYPPRHFEFSVLIEPEFKDKIEYVYEEPSPEDKDSEELERRIKELGKTESEEQ